MPTPARATQRRQFDHGLALIAVFSFAMVVVEIALLFAGPYEGFILRVVLLFPIAAAITLAAGLLAWRRRPFNQVGPLLILGGVVFLLAGLVNTRPHILIAIGQVFGVTMIAVFVHLLHAFPSGRITSRASRGIVGFAYVVMLVFHAPTYLFAPGPSTHETVTRITADQTLFDLGTLAARWGAIAVVTLTGAILLRRVLVAPPETRARLAILYVHGSLALILLVFAANLRGPLGLEPLTLFQIQLLLLASVPVAFVVGLLRGGFSKAGGMEELARGELFHASPDELGRALVSALGDPSARIHLVPEVPEPSRGRGAVDVLGGGVPIAVIAYDTSIYPSPEAVQSVASLFGLIIERDRLADDLREHEEELRRSRDRIVQAGDVERRRVATDLHDRLQSKLVLLAMRVQAEQPALAAAGAPSRSRPIGDDVAEVIDELRRVIDDVMPPLLMERGLAAALEELADRMPLPTELRVAAGERRLPEATESTLYFIASESLTNAVKHASATRLAITLAVDGERATLDIDDDGTGGAVPGGGLGLRSAADRVAAIGGAITIGHGPLGGTRIRAEVPCGS